MRGDLLGNIVIGGGCVNPIGLHIDALPDVLCESRVIVQPVSLVWLSPPYPRLFYGLFGGLMDKNIWAFTVVVLAASARKNPLESF